MLRQEDENDATSCTSVTGFTMMTPPTTETESVWDGKYYAIPWPGNTYIVIEKGSDRAITLSEDGLCLQELSQSQNANNRWLCVEKNGYFGLYNAKTGVYLGHDSASTMQACAHSLDEWELITPRLHPEGGYQLLMPFWAHTLMMITVEDDGKRLARRQHGLTTWEFIKV